MEWEDIILDSLESLDGLKKLVFRHFSHNFCWESGDQGRGPAKCNLIRSYLAIVGSVPYLEQGEG